MKKTICFFLLLFIPFEKNVYGKMTEANKRYTYEVLEHDLAIMRTKYNKQLEIKSIGKTHFGRDIWAVKLGKGEKNIVLVGAHHGREWLTSMLLMKMLETYAAAYTEQAAIGSNSAAILNEVSIWFIPMLNPDGVAIQQHQFADVPIAHQESLILMNEGSDNFKRWKANGVGVDLNRQYPAGWEVLKQASSVPNYKFYKGQKPLEAMEAAALANLIREINPSIAVAYHTAGREIYWEYKNGKHRKRDRLLAKKISNLTGYQLAKPAKGAVGGGFTDWFIITYHRPAMTIEISYLVGETNPPLSVFKMEWKRNKFVGLTLAAEAKKMRK